MKTHSIFAVLLGFLPWSTSATNQCNSPFYCATPEIRYAVMDKLQNMHLNATAISTYAVRNASDCQKLCIKESRCQSINLSKQRTSEYGCDLLDVNKYSSPWLVQPKNDSIHLYIPSKCRSNPCLNGALCIPSYINNAYTCECRSNATWITKGRHCEISLRDYQSAFLYFSFDDPAKPHPFTSSDLDVSRYFFQWSAIHEPGRRRPVLKCNSGDCCCFQIPQPDVPCVSVFSSCIGTVTYSIWLKVRKKQTGLLNIFRHMSEPQGPGIRLMSNTQNGPGFDFDANIGGKKHWSLKQFGKGVHKQRWNQFTITVDDSVGACAFVNGEKETCETSPVFVSFDTQKDSGMKVGGNHLNHSQPSLYMDDWAIWKEALTADDVRKLYHNTK